MYSNIIRWLLAIAYLKYCNIQELMQNFQKMLENEFMVLIEME